MLVYTLKRIFLAVTITLLSVLLLVSVTRILPGDPAAAIAGARVTPELRAAIESRMGLDKPLLKQYLYFVGRTIQGDFGIDVRSERPIKDLVFGNLPPTLSLIAASLAWSVPVGIVLGILAATRRGSLLDRLSGVISIATISVPPFVVALFLLLIFAVQLQLLPAIGAGQRGNYLDQLAHLILPAFALGLAWVGYVARLLRSCLLEVLQENHIRTARAYGLQNWRILYVYALRIAILPTVAVLGIGIGTMISGAVIVEIVFSRPGLGSLIFDAVTTRNYPVLLAGVLTTAILFSLATLIADLVAAALDPRIREAL